MSARKLCLSLLLLLSVPGGAAPTLTPMSTAPPQPPRAPREPHPRTLHGETVVDDYFWLRDLARPETLTHLRAEAAYADAVMRPTSVLQKTIYREILSRTREEDATPPYRRGSFEYAVRTHKGKEHAVYCRRALDGSGKPVGPEAVILDLNALAPKGGFVELGVFAPSDDGHLLAYSIDLVGQEQYTLYVKDLRTGRVLPDRLARVRSAAWAADGRTLLYAAEDDTQRAARVYRHTLGEAHDALVYEERDERFSVEVSRTIDDALLLITSGSHTQSEVRFLSASTPSAPPTLIAAREPDREYDVEHAPGPDGGTLYIRTNRSGRNFAIVTTPLTSPGPASWRDLVPHDEAIMREDFQVFAGYLVIEEREAGTRHLRVVDLATRAQHRVELDEPAREVSLYQNLVFDTPKFRFLYESPLTPPSYYDYDPRTRQRTLIKREVVPGAYDPRRYEVLRVEVPSGSVRVPVSIVQKKGVAHDGSAPVLLDGYGAYGTSMDVEFNESRFSLLDRGMILATAHIRGGGELGQRWHDDGRMMHKTHSFEDFIAVADWLVAQRWTRPSRLAILGGSAGGLLIGAVVNMRPELFGAAIAQVPFVDVVNTMLDETIPLTVAEFEEWGNPKLADQYRYLRRYCPYENVRPLPYPAILVTSALHDARAPYWEAAKWVAQLRATTTGDRPILFHIDLRSGGHGGPSGRYEQISDEAYLYAFVLTQLGAATAAATPASR